MTSAEQTVPIVVKKDATGGFDAPELNDEREHSLERSGAINVEYNASADRYEVWLVGAFHPSGRPILKPKRALINLSRTGVFQHVQRCRARWEGALASTKIMQRAPDGTPRDKFPYEEAWENPVGNDTFNSVAAALADAGSKLFEAIFERNQGTSLDDVARALRTWAGSGEDTISIDAPEFHIPWRMLYTHPADAGELNPDGSNFRPEGFWGLQHILEQFPEDFSLSDFRLVVQGGQLKLAAALHEKIDVQLKVPCVERHRDFVQSCGNRLAYQEWTDIATVKEGISSNPFPFHIVYFLCHAEGAGTDVTPNLHPYLELAGGRINAVDIRECIKRRFESNGPLIFVNACRGGHFETLLSHNFSFASEFLKQGAKGFVGAQIEVPAVFAGNFGKLFFEAMMSADGGSPPLVGRILRNLTREMWHKRNPLGLVYSLYAGADCHVVWDGETGT